MTSWPVIFSSNSLPPRLRTMVVAVVFLLGLATACTQDGATHTIRISGTEGTAVSGHYIVSTDEVRITERLEAKVRQTIAVPTPGATVSCFLQKQSASGVVRVEILRDDVIVAFGETRDPHGIITVVTP